jgi:protein-S-isoprenylcysteine O-methyltransferase Ste14
MASLGIKLGRLFDRKGIFVVQRKVRDWSRPFEAHGLRIPRRASTSRRLSPLEGYKMTEGDAPNVRIIPPLVYLAGLVIGLVISIWIPTTVVSSSLALTVGGILILCGAVLAASAIFNFKSVGTTVRPDQASSALVIVGPYKITRNPMYLGLALVYAGISIADQSIWALILLPVVMKIIQRQAIEREEVFLESRFGADYLRYKGHVRRWI